METFSDRLRIMQVFLGIVFGLLLVRYGELQLIRGSDYEIRAENNTTRYVRIQPQRGLVIGSDGITIGSRILTFHLDVYGADRQTLIHLAEVLRALLPHRSEEIDRRSREWNSRSPYIPVTLLRNLSIEELGLIESRRFYYPQFFIQQALSRHYPKGNLFCHALGYVGDVSLSDLSENESLTAGDQIGKTGLEQFYDRQLRGEAGEWLVVVDATEKEINRFLRTPDRTGDTLRVSLNARVQEEAAKLMEGKTGSVVLMKLNGEILVYLSLPQYDPNLFLTGLTRAQWKGLINDPGNPLLDRCVKGLYPPGSLIKPFLAANALSSGRITPQQTVTCAGGYRLGDHFYRCWQRGGHGVVNLELALDRKSVV